MKVEYDSNNSGGSWWLSGEDWKALEAAGWVVHWRSEPFLGALATKATREGLSSIEEAIDEWEKITGLDSQARGCDCCGPPHRFDEVEEPEAEEAP